MVNFVVLCIDHQRADSLGCAGNREATTPSLDALAARGIRFTHHYTPNRIERRPSAGVPWRRVPDLRWGWCRGEDLNLHGVTPTST